MLENLGATSKDITELQNKIESWFNEYMQRVTGWYKSNTVVTVRIIAVAVTLFFNINVIKLTREIFTNAQMRAVLTDAAMNMEANQQLMDAYMGQGRKATIDSINAAYTGQLAAAKTSADSAGVQIKLHAAQSDAVKLYNKKSLEGVDSLYQKINVAGIPLGWNGGVLANILARDKAGQVNGGDTAIQILWMLLGWAIAAGCISMGAPFWFDILVKIVNIRRAGIVPGKGDGK